MNYIVHSEFYKTPYCICRVKQPIQQVKCREGLDFWAGLEVMSVNYIIMKCTNKSKYWNIL